ncbi:Na+/H+ antiporter NhaC family protein [Cloacibacillus sp.]|uniref:Na+/H+ antiporter NhaC family protein n=1 Tax=Cloacibacillus sp. TaxID=2049023 RepID=UPI0025C0A195|nr:Na+/H+ antiporter NhaC family protein [Cloacibacillus sp.]MCC8058968.1 sodium:proton exchanger [Cloacibacillus sp.]
MNVMENFGFLSILPPALAIILAVITKNVLVSLFSSIFLGAVILFNGNVFYAVPALFRDFLFKQAADGYNASVIVLVFFIGGMVMLVTSSGGAEALAVTATRRINSRKKAMLSAWMLGLLIWFSDFANGMLVGPIFQPITDRLKISHEKLAWIVDSTSAPVCMLVPISGFGIFAMSCIEKEFTAYNVNMPVWDAFLQTIPLQFYCIGALVMIPLIACIGLDFGPMAKAEERVLTSGKLHWDHAQPMGLGEPPILSNDAKPRISLVIYPIIAVFVIFFAILIANGFPYEKIVGVNIRTGLTTGYFVGGMICFGLMILYKIRNFKETFNIYLDGMKNNLFLVMTLLFAWSLSSVCKQLGTAQYIVHIVQGNLPVYFVAPIFFVVGAIISFATGTSYGTFAILIPIAIPMSISLGAPMIATLAAVFSGGIFGDHCSPISDTTLLASMGAACDHIEHVKTQLPYAIMVGVVTFAGYMLSYWVNSPIVLALSAVVGVCAITLIFSKIHGVNVSGKI